MCLVDRASSLLNQVSDMYPGLQDVVNFEYNLSE
jgi:hypothetical protein